MSKAKFNGIIYVTVVRYIDEGCVILENITKNRILYSSFRLFLENGYEATNIRNICAESGIKASTLYFYFKSKQELFIYNYDSIWINYLKYLGEIDTFKVGISVKEKLCMLLKKTLEYYGSDLSKQKFLLRYHLFPPEEISDILREKYKFYISEEKKIIFDSIKVDKDNYYFEYKKLENHLLYEMVVSSVKIKDEDIEIWFAQLWANVIE